MKKYYAVKVGRVPGIYGTWRECKREVIGFSRASFKGFTSREEAEKWLSSSDNPRKGATTQKSARRNFNPHLARGPSKRNLYQGKRPPWEYPTFIRCVGEEWTDPLDYSAPGLAGLRRKTCGR